MQKKEKATIFRAAGLNDLVVFKASYQRFQFDKHAHEDFALGVMNRGIQKFHHRGEDVCATPNSLIAVNEGEIHDGMSADGNIFDYNIIYIPTNLIKEISSEYLKQKESCRFSQPVICDQELAFSLHTIFNLLADKKSSSLELQSAFYTTLSKLLQRYSESSSELEDLRQLPVAIRKACDYISDMATSDISLEDIAHEAGLSRFHFLRLFRSAVGTTPHIYLIQRRLQLAKAEMRQGSPIADAALYAGFSDQSHFSRKFKSAFGITPGQYRKAVC